jgi:hypothetical protein
VRLFFLHCASTWFLTGLIWVVQSVHYPLFGHVGAEAYAAYQAAHVRRITWLVGPAMLVEAATAVAMLSGVPGLSRGEAALNAALLVGIWFSTMTLQVPVHERLAAGFDSDAHRRLVSTNWLRTAFWSTRAMLLLFAATRIGSAHVRPI